MGKRDKHKEYRGRCVSAAEGDWKSITNLKANPRTAHRLGEELSDIEVCRAYITENDTEGNRAVEEEFFTEEFLLPSGIPVMRNPAASADAVWLWKKDAFVDLVNGRLLYLAIAGEFYLAGRYTTQSAELIATSFRGHRVEPCDIRVTSFFSSPAKDAEQAHLFESACVTQGIPQPRRRFQLPLNGEYPYETHEDPETARLHGLGIIMRP